MKTRLEDLPAFEVQDVIQRQSAELAGIFTHLKSVRVGRSWLYAGDANSLIGHLVEIDEVTRRGKFIAPFWSPESPIEIGSVVPWLDGFWQAFQVTMILDPDVNWKRTEFVPTPAQYFRQGTLVGWMKVGQKLPDGAILSHVDEAGWDHEHCVLCRSKIGRGGSTHGYVEQRDRWLCEACYENYAAPHDLGFVFCM